MKLWSSRPIHAVAGMAVVGIALAGQAAAQTGQAAPVKSQTAGAVFKNVTTSTLKGTTVAEFLGSMGVMSAALGFDCADCHKGAGTDTVDWAYDTSKKVTARRMVEMVDVINRTNFGGVQLVSCYTCHHGRDRPAGTIALDAMYGPPNEEKDDIVAPATEGPSADQILDKYVQALGGAQRLAGLTSFVVTGTSLGYEGIGGGGEFQLLAKAPDLRTTIIEFKDHPDRGNSIRTYNGHAGWIKAPRGLFAEYELTGLELDAAKLDAQLSFPGQIKKVLTNLHAGYPQSFGDRELQVVQGNGPRGVLATLYFDKQSGLLVRLVRYSRSPIGRVPVQVDYSDYRDVGGIKFPFQYTFSRLDGKDSFKVNDVKVNVPIDARRFDKP